MASILKLLLLFALSGYWHKSIIFSYQPAVNFLFGFCASHQASVDLDRRSNVEPLGTSFFFSQSTCSPSERSKKSWESGVKKVHGFLITVVKQKQNQSNDNGQSQQT